ncbi:hypothetical protein [Candidatus Odyssella acanthamoebae]|nr:hypothetical protein [Candidatus Paracaedibacter acanthamoebae]
MYQKIIIPILSLLSLFLPSAYTMDHGAYWNERAQPLSVLSVPYNNPPAVCQYEDFKTPCRQHDQACKTRKEKCGDAIGAQFNEGLFSAQYGFSKMTIHNGKYDSIHGIDDFRTAEKDGTVHHHFTENKAHMSKLDRKTNQGGNDWHGKRLDQAHRADNLPLPHYQRARQALDRGEATRVLAHTTWDIDQQHVSFTFQPLISQHPQRRPVELQSYCTFLHEPIRQFAQQHDPYQTPQQRINLARLDTECQQVLSSGRSAPRLIPPSLPVPSFVKSYNRDNLYKFLNYLNKRYTQEDIAGHVGLSKDTIGRIIRNKDYAPTANYLSLWNSLKSNLPTEFAQWLAVKD